VRDENVKNAQAQLLKREAAIGVGDGIAQCSGLRPVTFTDVNP
jgi:hypothetical protein